MKKIKHPDFEGLNWNRLASLFKLCSFLYLVHVGFTCYNDYTRHQVTVTKEYHNQAFDKCVTACTNVSFGILDAAKKGSSSKMSEETYEEYKENFNRHCNDECQYI